MAKITDEQLAAYREALAEMRENATLETNATLPIVNMEDLAMEDVTEDFLIEHFYEMGTALGVDTRQGSIYWDACMGGILRTAFFFDMLQQVKDIVSLWTCTGEVLDEKLHERGLTRNPEVASSAIYEVSFVGEMPEFDSAMSCGDLLFSFQELDGRYVIVSEDTGTEMNNLVPGTEVIPEIDVDGLISATLGELIIPAVDIEDDDSARERLINKISGPDENGNQSQIKTWCESVDGVGRARVIPLWNGANTVLAIIIDKNGQVPVESVVKATQKYVDPDVSGKGEGAATIGQFVTVVAVEAVTINVAVSVLKTQDATLLGIQEQFKELLKEYFKEMALEEYSDGMAIRYGRAVSLLEQVKGITDYDNLTLNGASENVPFSIRQVPVLGEVTVNGDI